MEPITSNPEMLPEGMSFEDAINVAKSKEEIEVIGAKLGLVVDGRMSLEHAKKGILDAYRDMIKTARQTTEKVVKEIAKEGEPIVKIRFSILDILNPEESPLFEFCNDCGKGVKEGGPIPLWSFMHGEEYDVPYGIYEFLNTLTIPRSKWVEDPAAPGGKRCVTYQQKRFNCELLISKKQILQLQNA